MSLSPQKQRRLDELSEVVDRVLESDHRFFQRHPDRSHRVRRAAQAEVEVGTLPGRMVRLPRGWVHYTIIRQVSPGVRVRKFVAGTSGADTDLSEDQCRALYEQSQDARSQALEHWLSAAIGGAR